MSFAKYWKRSLKPVFRSFRFSYASFISDAEQPEGHRCQSVCPTIIGMTEFYCTRPPGHEGAHANHMTGMKVDWNSRGFLNVTGEQ